MKCLFPLFFDHLGLVLPIGFICWVWGPFVSFFFSFFLLIKFRNLLGVLFGPIPCSGFRWAAAGIKNQILFRVLEIGNLRILSGFFFVGM